MTEDSTMQGKGYFTRMTVTEERGFRNHVYGDRGCGKLENDMGNRK